MLQLADDIVVLDKGRVIKQGPYQKVKAQIEHLSKCARHDQCGDLPAHDMSQPKPQNMSHETERTSSTDGEENVDLEPDLLRKTGSWSVYTYYFGSAGYSLLTLFSIFTMIECFCSSFSGMRFEV